MPYATVAEVIAAIGAERLDTFVPDDSEATVQSVINAQSAEMDVYIGRLYDVPLNITSLTAEQQANLNAMLKRWIIALTLYALIPQGSSGVPKGVQIAYDRVRSRLTDLILGKYQLPYINARFTPAFQIIGDVETTLTTQLFNAARYY